MKTKLFFISLLLAFSFTACDLEREEEITHPNLPALEANYWSDLEAEDTEIQVFDHFANSRNIVNGLHHLTVLGPNEKYIRYIGAEVEAFYKGLSTKVVNTDETVSTEDIDSTIKLPQAEEQTEEQQIRRDLHCTGPECRESIRLEIGRLQKIARENCLSMVASFNCCQAGKNQEIMVYLTPGVYCEQNMFAQKKVKFSNPNH